jgi:hypothetical protein
MIRAQSAILLFLKIQLGILNGVGFFPSHNTFKILVGIDECP